MKQIRWNSNKLRTEDHPSLLVDGDFHLWANIIEFLDSLKNTKTKFIFKSKLTEDNKGQNLANV